MRCDHCDSNVLPGHSRFAIIQLWEEAKARKSPSVKVIRKKPVIDFKQTKVPFDYDSDDYRYLPGLERPNDSGFLTPVFFSKVVLLKYDALPQYGVKFASTTYGTIYGDDFYISFGINKNGKVIMWLGDIAQLPEKEQYYLVSENIPSDHSIGSEFYDGQIEAKFTARSKEDTAFNARSMFIEACTARWSERLAHLDIEVLDLLSSFNAPVVDTESERRRVSDTLNKIYVESFDNKALAKLATKLGTTADGSGNLKRLQAVLLTVAKDTDDIKKLMSPFFTLYDFRVVSLHLTSTETSEDKMKTVTDRLALPQTASLLEIYDALVKSLAVSFDALAEIVNRT